ncbi:class A sortase [Candidatus Enterococcus leclercqii]|uniref:class A sortase n=1 Tax=Candidatus Enterococcus leclercqii TaxID=1857218 RepID=UPI00137A05FE|nr:class A sortase [Enterococcus sp. CU9D]KAF1290792.1 class A sortase [Enterococcus sp. CU9D]
MATKKKKHRVRNGLINLFLLLLLVAGLVLVFNNQIKNFLMDRNTEKFAVSKLSREEIVANEEKPATFDFDAVVPASSEAVFKAQWQNRELPVIGGVALPAVGINLPIFKGLSNEALLWGAGTMFEEQVMGQGNYSLASHRAYDKGYLFEPLDQTKIGDPIYLTDLENIYTYKATLNIKVVPTDTQYIDEVPGKKLITLITCDAIGGKNRIVVQGELQSVTPIKEASNELKSAFGIEAKHY